MQHPDEGTIHAWIDGELSQEDRAALEAHLAECSDCSEKAAEARGLVAASSRIVSALDIVPGGVIPAAAARRRPWYASTQLRAAAAIAIVAGASMLVMRDGKKATMDSVLPVTAPAAQNTEADMPVAQSEAPAASAASVPADAARDLRKEKEAPAPRERLDRQSAAKIAETPPHAEGAAAAAAAAPVPVPPSVAAPATVPLARRSADEASRLLPKVGNTAADSVRRQFGLPLNDAVVGGVAAASLEMKELRADTTAGVQRTVYQVSPGVEVTLTDADPLLQRRSRIAATTGAAAARPAPSVAAPQRAALEAVSVNSITWKDKRGHTMTLTGPVSKEQLEAIRRLLPEDKR